MPDNSQRPAPVCPNCGSTSIEVLGQDDFRCHVCFFSFSETSPEARAAAAVRAANPPVKNRDRNNDTKAFRYWSGGLVVGALIAALFGVIYWFAAQLQGFDSATERAVYEAQTSHYFFLCFAFFVSSQLLEIRATLAERK